MVWNAIGLALRVPGGKYDRPFDANYSRTDLTQANGDMVWMGSPPRLVYQDVQQ